ncbi:MAG: molybdopterin molybdotransferase MoeA [Planctomycetota bacterium]
MKSIDGPPSGKEKRPIPYEYEIQGSTIMKERSADSPVAHPPLMEPDEALALVLENTSVESSMELPLAQAAGKILALPVTADRDYPPFDRAMMDGVAVRTSDAGKAVEIIGEVAAGQASEIELLPGTCVEIMTGAVCPRGTEAVVQKELISRSGSWVTLPAPIAEGKNISLRGSDCASRSITLQPGDTLTPLAIGMMASFGYTHASVLPNPRLAVISTGREVIAPDAKPGPCQIRDANGPLLLAMASQLSSLTDTMYELAGDTETSISAALERVESCNLILLTGGVSAGKYDIVPDCLKSYGAKILFHKVRQKPGKPLLFATRGRQLIFGLPGNPLAAHLCFHRYVAAALRKMTGNPPHPVGLTGELTGPLVPKGLRDRFDLVHAALGRNGWKVTPGKTVSSADLFNASQANAYVRVPAGSEKIPAGQSVEFFIIGEWGWTS